jgi:hypothetical protein
VGTEAEKRHDKKTTTQHEKIITMPDPGKGNPKIAANIPSAKTKYAPIIKSLDANREGYSVRIME